MNLSRSAEIEPIRVKAIEGKPMLGGDLVVKPLLAGDEMTLLEVRYAPGVGSPPHAHGHESIVYVIKGRLKTTVGGETYVLGPGDACRHPKGVPHSVEAIEESVMVEVKSPAPALSSFFKL